MAIDTVLDGRYHLVEVLSEESRATVYRATHTKLDRDVVVRLFEAGPSSPFEETARRLSGLKHPNIETILDYGRTPDGRPYLVTERLEGETLAERMTRPMHQAEVLRIVQDVAAALAEAHAAGVVHGNLAPEQVFIEERACAETVKLTGFAIDTGQAPAPSFISDDLVARAEWCAPEEATGRSPEGASDLYALGAIAYACLAGSAPLNGAPRVVLSKKLESTPESLRSVPQCENLDPDVDALIMSLLERDPLERPVGARMVAEEAGALADEIELPQMAPPTQPVRAPWFALGVAVSAASMLLLTHTVPPCASSGASTGYVTIDSHPPGAAVYLNGRRLDYGGTPWHVDNLRYGETYRVQLKREGYVTWETELTMSEGMDGRHYYPTLAPMPASLEVRTTPGADVLVDGAVAGRGPVAFLSVDPDQTHVIRARSADGECEQRTVTAQPGARIIARLDCGARPHPQRGRGVHLTITGDPSAQVSVDQQPIGTPPIVDYTLPSGVHRVTIERTNETRNLVVDAAPGEMVRYHVY